MAKSNKKGGSGQRISKKHEQKQAEPAKIKSPPTPIVEKPQVEDRIQEEDAGFGVIKVVLIALLLLIVGATMLSRLSGSENLSRGNSGQDESCEGTQECTKGFICHSFRGQKKACMQRCNPSNNECGLGYTCISDAKSGRKKTRVRTVCVKDATL